jgi:hypothetical protein
VASNRGAARAEQQAAAAAPPPAPAPAEAAASAETSAGSSEDSFNDLMKLKELLDAGALTQEEFDAEKAKVLAR